MNRSELRAECQARIQDDTSDIAQASQVNLWLNQKIDEISTFTNWPFLRETVSLNIVANQDTVTLPADCRVVAKVTIGTGFDFPTPLIPAPLGQMLDAAPSYATRPTHYTMGSLLQTLRTDVPVQTLRLYPSADTNYTLSVTYYKQPTLMEADNHHSPYPREFEEALILGTMVLYWQQVEAEDMVRTNQRAYEDKLAQLRYHYGQEFYERLPQIEIMDEGEYRW